MARKKKGNIWDKLGNIWDKFWNYKKYDNWWSRLCAKHLVIYPNDNVFIGFYKGVLILLFCIVIMYLFMFIFALLLGIIALLLRIIAFIFGG